MERRRLEAVAAVSADLLGRNAPRVKPRPRARMDNSIRQLRFPLKEDIKKTRPIAPSTVATTKLAVEISKRP
jgi:hypothetical protein